MKRIENDCVRCPTCINCGAKQQEHFYCDECKEESDIYHFEGEELCIECISKRLIKVD